MGRLFISLTVAPETQKNFLRIHKRRMIQSDLQSWHFKREIWFKRWWHNTTIRLQGGREFPKVEKLRGLHLEKILQYICLYKSWGHVRAMWLWWWALADSAQKTSVCALARTRRVDCQGAHPAPWVTLPSATVTSAGVSQKSQDLGSE